MSFSKVDAVVMIVFFLKTKGLLLTPTKVKLGTNFIYFKIADHYILKSVIFNLTTVHLKLLRTSTAMFFRHKPKDKDPKSGKQQSHLIFIRKGEVKYLV